MLSTITLGKGEQFYLLFKFTLFELQFQFFILCSFYTSRCSIPNQTTQQLQQNFLLKNTFYIDLNVSTRLRNIHKCFWKNIVSNYYLWIDKMFWLPKSYFAIVNNSLSETWKSIGWWKFGTLLDWTRSYKASTTHCPVQTQSNQHKN